MCVLVVDKEGKQIVIERMQFTRIHTKKKRAREKTKKVREKVKREGVDGPEKVKDESWI